MIARSSKPFCIAAVVLGFLVLPPSTYSADAPAATVSADDLATRLGSLRKGSSYVRVRMEVKQPGTAPTVLQLQIKERRSKGATDLVYQVLFPKDRQGEAVLLRKAGNRAATGTIFVPPNTVRSLGLTEMTEPLFGSDLSYEDVIDDFFTWDDQALVGIDEIDGIKCNILESRPGKNQRSSYTSVRTWVDVRRAVPLRIEKHRGSGDLARRINTTRLVPVGGRQIPANLTVSGTKAGSVTELDGSRIRHGVTFSDREFTPEGLREIKASQSTPE